VVVAARDEADRIEATLAGLDRAFPGAPVWVVDDGSTDATADIAGAAGARVVRTDGGASRRRGGRLGKGRAITLGVRAAAAEVFAQNAAEVFSQKAEVFSQKVGAARAAARARAYARTRGSLESKDTSAHLAKTGACQDDTSAGARQDGSPDEPVLVLCDGDLGESASALGLLADAVRGGEADLAIAAFSTRANGGLGLALAFARWAVRRRCGLRSRTPLSGQRALRVGVLRDVIPFANGYGMEIGMTIDVVRAGHKVIEVDLPLDHRPTGRQLAGFLHRARQLVDFVRVYVSRRSGRPSSEPCDIVKNN
jgi:glycosyltransferase involved in cell wall biosynthesis